MTKMPEHIIKMMEQYLELEMRIDEEVTKHTDGKFQLCTLRHVSLWANSVEEGKMPTEDELHDLVGPTTVPHINYSGEPHHHFMLGDVRGVCVMPVRMFDTSDLGGEADDVSVNEEA